jgi:galactose mutarotase-like enzyme
VTAYDSATLASPDGLTATFVPGTGMVGVSLRDGTTELLGQRRGLEAYATEGKTMGIPLLHPWANRLAADEYTVDGTHVRIAPGATGVRRDGNGLAMHGLLAGARGWQVVDQDEATLVATFDFGAHADLLASFPFPHVLRLAVTLRARTLTIETTLTATGDVAVPVAYGFHPYLTVPGVARADWEIELPAMRSLELDELSVPTGASEPAPAFDGTLGDRAYDDAFTLDTDTARFAVSGGDRRIEVHFEGGFSAAQVYAPLTEDVVCFEPMTAPTNALRSGDRLRTVAPGGEDVTSFAVVVAP